MKANLRARIEFLKHAIEEGDLEESREHNPISLLTGLIVGCTGLPRIVGFSPTSKPGTDSLTAGWRPGGCAPEELQTELDLRHDIIFGARRLVLPNFVAGSAGCGTIPEAHPIAYDEWGAREAGPSCLRLLSITRYFVGMKPRTGLRDFAIVDVSVTARTLRNKPGTPGPPAGERAPTTTTGEIMNRL